MKTYKELIQEADQKLSDDALPHDIAGHFIKNLPSKGGEFKPQKFNLKPLPPRRGRV